MDPLGHNGSTHKNRRPDKLNLNGQKDYYHVSSEVPCSEKQLQKCRLERLRDEEIQKIEEERLQEIIMFCQKYNEMQSSVSKKIGFTNIQEADCSLYGKLNSNGAKKDEKMVPILTKNNNGAESVENLDMDSPTSTLTSYSGFSDQSDEILGATGGKSKKSLQESSETLNALIMEEAFLRCEIDEIQQQHFSDEDDEELEEFQKIEKEIKLGDLYKCLQAIEEQILERKQPVQHIEKDAPLASGESESACDEDSLHINGNEQESNGYEKFKEEINFGRVCEDTFQTKSDRFKLDMEEKTVEYSAVPQPEPVQRQRINSKKSKQQRPLTLYLPSESEDLNLISHIQTLGHDIFSFSNQVELTNFTCSGYLMKLCSRNVNKWRKRYFHFNRINKILIYYKALRDFEKMKEPKDGVYFDEIQDVYVDHNRTKYSASNNVAKDVSKENSLMRRKKHFRHTFVVSTTKRNFTLSAASPEVMRIWIDCIFTGAQAYLDYEFA